MTTPTPEAIADCLRVAELGGDLARLAEVCLIRADDIETFGADGRRRLIEAAAELRWAADLIAAMDKLEAAEKARAGG